MSMKPTRAMHAVLRVFYSDLMPHPGCESLGIRPRRKCRKGSGIVAQAKPRSGPVIEQLVEAVVERGTYGLRLNANELHVDVNRKVPQPVLGYEWRHRRRKCRLCTQRTSSNARLPPVNCHMN